MGKTMQPLKTSINPLTDSSPLKEVKVKIAVASGKGGVGKSTVAVNLAYALNLQGKKTGLLDIDIYGPSLPMMTGVNQKPLSDGKKIFPIDHQGLRLMSIGFLVQEDTPVIWRGLLVTSAVRQFIRDVEWGELDYLIIDMPPGTGDAQLTLVQTIPLTGAVIVTTPQDIALIDASKGVRMFQQVKVPILGIVENMSNFTCPHCGHETSIFDKGGGKKESERLQVPYLGEIPIDPAIRSGCDTGHPIVVSDPNSPSSLIYHRLARVISEQLHV